MPDCSGKPAVINACATYQCTRGCGCAKHPAFPAPSFEGETEAKLGQNPAARLLNHIPSAVMPREGGIQYSRGVRRNLIRLWNTGSPDPASAKAPARLRAQQARRSFSEGGKSGDDTEFVV
jgi:hypothetical protein